MTATRFQSLVTLASNSAWVRHWLHWNYPVRDPWIMAISLRDFDGNDVENLYWPQWVSDGFERVEQDGKTYYTVRRTEIDGSPFRGCRL